MRNVSCWLISVKIVKLLLWCRSCFVGKKVKLRIFQSVTGRFAPSYRLQTLFRARKAVPFPYTGGIYDRTKQSLSKLKKYLLQLTVKKGILLAQGGVWVCPREATIIQGRGKPEMIRSVDRVPILIGTRRNNTASPQRESGRENKSGNGVTTPVFGNASLQETRTPSCPVDELSRPGAQQSNSGRFSPPGENKADQQETESHALVPYGHVLDVEPESYVLPPKIPSTKRYEEEVGSPIAWEEKNPTCYRSVGPVRSFHPSWNGNPSSKSKDTRAPKGVEGAKQQENESVTDRTPPSVENDAAQGKKQTQSVGHESGETSNLEVSKSGEQLEKVHSPMAGIQAIVKEINAKFPVPEEEERYDSCKDAISDEDTSHGERRSLSANASSGASNAVIGGRSAPDSAADENVSLAGDYTVSSAFVTGEVGGSNASVTGEAVVVGSISASSSAAVRSVCSSSSSCGGFGSVADSSPAVAASTATTSSSALSSAGK
ncbi:hypothetical protein Bca52824_017608 [Brassica carinata]|uniref:Uncharacterized protein n=1 Tax=Brassica carinata TaxID=52824 RepID=A0A8X7VND9_BRACI|nr:hypothetical protein Bca52824_017608 [Brassica carinata]